MDDFLLFQKKRELKINRKSSYSYSQTEGSIHKLSPIILAQSTASYKKSDRERAT